MGRIPGAFESESGEQELGEPIEREAATGRED